jgi:type VI secretion system protein ImpH
MGAPLGPETAPISQPEVERRLRAEPWEYDFFQAVRLLSRLEPGRAPIGAFAAPRTEVVRVGVQASLSFPASQIHSLSWEQGKQPLMRVNFIGLIGPLGVLPHYYTELVIERLRARDSTLRDFLDIFHHRIASLFYQAWERSHFTVAYERDRRDPLTGVMLDLAGLGTGGLRNRQAVRDETILFYGGLFGMATRPAAALESILADYFDVPVEVEQFIGVWRPLEPNDWCVFESGASAASQLGFGAVAGDEIWDRQSRVRIRIGPLPVDRYLDFLPEGSAYEPLRALTKAFCGNEIEFEVQLILQRDHVPACELGGAGSAGPMLGWLTWLKSKPEFPRDPGDTILLLT